MAFGLKYEDKWTVRAEYVTSQGHKISDYSVDENGQATVSGNTMLMPGMPWWVYRSLHVARFMENGMYTGMTRPPTLRNPSYGLAMNYYFYKNLKIQALYNFVDDRSYAGDQHYNQAEIQLLLAILIFRPENISFTISFLSLLRIQKIRTS